METKKRVNSLPRNIRMQPDLIERGAIQAVKEQRSFASLVNYAVQKYLESQGA